MVYLIQLPEFKGTTLYKVGHSINEPPKDAKLSVVYVHNSAVFLYHQIIKIFSTKYSQIPATSIFEGLETDLISSFMHIMLEHEKQLEERFIQACKDRNLDMVKRLVTAGVNIRCKNNQSARWAVLSGSLDLVLFLIENGVNIHDKDDAALQLAAKKGFLDIVTLILKKGANIHANGENALQLAVDAGNIEVVRVLLANGANLHISDDNPLQLASKNGNIGMVKLLLTNGANIHGNKDNSLYLAASRGNVMMAEFLISNGADIGTLRGIVLSNDIKTILNIK